MDRFCDLHYFANEIHAKVDFPPPLRMPREIIVSQKAGDFTSRICSLEIRRAYFHTPVGAQEFNLILSRLRAPDHCWIDTWGDTAAADTWRRELEFRKEARRVLNV